ncbi:MAG: SnoaL-like domain-containing protein [Pseudomonadota bacterium]
MDIRELAAEFYALIKDNKIAEAQEKFYSDDIRSIEPMPGEHSDVTGKAALAEKYKWWEANATVHDEGMGDGPKVHGDQFAITFWIDVTMTGMDRMKMDEVGLYTVKDGKIVEERFFY